LPPWTKSFFFFIPCGQLLGASKILYFGKISKIFFFQFFS
jgi:hypothetical protein